MPRASIFLSTLSAGSLVRNLPTVVLSLTAFLAPLLTIYAPLGMAPLFAITAAILACGLIADRHPIRLARPAVWIGLGLLLWCAASLTWTINPKGALVTLGQLSGFFLCALIAFSSTAAADGRPIAKALLAGVALALAIYAFERMFDAPIQHLFKDRPVPGPFMDRDAQLEVLYSAFNRGLAVLIMLLPTVIIAFRKSRPELCLALAGAIVAVTFNYYGSAMTLAALAAYVVFAAALIGPWFTRSLGVIAVIAVMAGPFVVHSLITPGLLESVSRSAPVSAQHRLAIWRFASEKIMEKPLLGWGLDSARVMPGGKDKIVMHYHQCVQPPCAVRGEKLPLHPHNMALQLWLELGAVGAALGAALIFGLFWAIAAAPVPRVDRALLSAQASAGLIIAGLSYGVWQTWWLSALALACVLSICVLSPETSRRSAGP